MLFMIKRYLLVVPIKIRCCHGVKLVLMFLLIIQQEELNANEMALIRVGLH